jgi:hypothetical protein
VDRSFERVEEFKYLGTTLTNLNSIQQEIKSKLKSGNACYHLVQNILPYSLPSKNVRIKIYRTIIPPVVVYGCETWLPTLKEEGRMRVFESRVPRKKHNEELNDLCCSPNIVWVITSRIMRWEGHVVHMGERRGI